MIWGAENWDRINYSSEKYLRKRKNQEGLKINDEMTSKYKLDQINLDNFQQLAQTSYWLDQFL